MKKNLFIYLQLIVCCLMVLPTGVGAAPVGTWTEARTQLQFFNSMYSKSTSRKHKEVQFPAINDLFGSLSELKLTPAQRLQKIDLVVSIIGAVIDEDSANSMADTVYFDYKQNKAEYLAAIGKLPATQRKSVLDSFKTWERFESKIDDPEITGIPHKKSSNSKAK